MTNQRLNDLLIDLSRSLLQYAGEAWPWTAEGGPTATRDAVMDLVRRQQDSARQIVDLLIERHHPIDFGIYPDEYSSLHYVSLDYLLGQLIVNEQAILEECDAVARDTKDDPDAGRVVLAVREHEQRALSELRGLKGRS